MDRRPSEMSEESGTSPARQADHSPQTSPRAGRRSVLSSVSGCPSDSENSWGQAPRRKLHAEFHKVEQKTKSGHLSEAESGWLRAKVAYVLDSDTLVNCMVVTILVDSVCALIDTDYRAMKLDVPVYSEVISITCLGIYTLELSALLWVNGASALKKKSILFDAFTLACGYSAAQLDHRDVRERERESSVVASGTHGRFLKPEASNVYKRRPQRFGSARHSLRLSCDQHSSL